MRPRPAVFLGLEGTLVETALCDTDPAGISLAEGAGRALLRLCVAGYVIVVVSDRPGAVRGCTTEDARSPLEQRVSELLERWAVRAGGFYACPHNRDESLSGHALACSCRKPEPGLLIAAACDLDLDLPRSWVVGNVLDDIEAGRRAGCRTLLLDRGHETEWRRGAFRTPERTASCFADAAGIIVRTGMRPALPSPPEVMREVTPRPPAPPTAVALSESLR